MFKKYFLCIAVMLAACSMQVFASGIQVLGTEVTTNTDKKNAQVKFTLTWDHSWRMAAGDGPANWDAAWVFVKYRTLPGDNWRHAYIKNEAFVTSGAGKNIVPGNASGSIGTSIYPVSGVNTTVGVGAFIFRNAAGNGNITFENVELNWDFTKNGLSGGEQVEVCVLATEMVYIPQGPFWAGDLTSQGRLGRNRSNPVNVNYTQRTEEALYVNYSGSPLAIATYLNNFSNTWMNSASYPANPNGLYNNSISSITVPATDDATAGNLYIRTNTYDNQGSTTWYTTYMSAISANFPRGFFPFYCMKYEITQGEYLQFLNKNVIAVRNADYYFPGEKTDGRYDITKVAGSSPTTYKFKDGKETSAYLPCGYLSTKNIMGWLVWAGLRPMTELEFEKVCRGPVAIPPALSATSRPQFAWGEIDITPATGFNLKSQANEASSNNANCTVQLTSTVTATPGAGTNAAIDGPIRAGGFASPVSSRKDAGASFYGVMEMSGNLWERCITLGTDAGRAFQGQAYSGTTNGHGNGETGPAANPDLPIGGAWPGVTSNGLGFRGGSYLDPQEQARISDRKFINYNAGSNNHRSWGGRGVRSANN